MVHALLGLPTLDAVLGHPVVGGSWEDFVIENLLAAAPNGAQAWFYRTAAGAEIDLDRAARGRALGNRGEARIRAVRFTGIPVRV